jgi:hypothetical protein
MGVLSLVWLLVVLVGDCPVIGCGIWWYFTGAKV